MAEPVTRKIDTLPNAITVANNDELIVMDVSESAVNMTKKMTMSQIPISLASQLGTDVVENAKIKDDAVRTSKILDGNVTYAKIQKSQNAFVLGNKASTTGTADAIVEIQPSAASQVLLGSTGTTNTVDFGKVTSAHIEDNAVTEAKLGTIKRTVVLRLTSPLDDVEVVNYGGLFPWSVSLNSFIVVDARINLSVAGSTNTTVVLSNQGGTMSTLTLTSGATGLSASGTVSSSYRTASTNGFLGVNVTAAGTGAKGLSITLVLQGVPA